MLDSFRSKSTLLVQGQTYTYFSLKEAAKKLGNIDRLPFSLKIFLENLLRYEDGNKVTSRDIEALAAWLKEKRSDHEIPFIRPEC